MIYQNDTFFLLETNHTSYAFHVLASGHLDHIHYGARLQIAMDDNPRKIKEIFEPFREKKEFLPGNSICYDKAFPTLGLEDQMLELSGYGKGDIREPFVEIKYHDGSISCDFLYDSATITKGKEALLTLPSSYAEEDAAEVEQLTVITKDRCHAVKLLLQYTVFPSSDVIIRSAKIINEMEEPVYITRLMSTQLDLDETGLVFTHFTGAWAREMKLTRQVCNSGLFINQSVMGVSSNRANPFVMVSNQETTEEFGECYGFHLLYSGNHYEALEVNAFGKSRFVSGINPRGFSWKLQPKETLEAPEAAMTFSEHGFSELSHHIHQFIRTNIIRGKWKYKERPVLLNSWEASYFNFNENQLIKLAKAAKEAGIELFVMDDGWFGKRDNDTCSLGDWVENEKKLPGGITGLSEKIRALGLDFGIWVEPEMVNEDSDCYRKHPDWAVIIPNQPHSLGRNQMILDLTKKDVRDYIIDSMSKVFAKGNISYVKWDMNRIFSDAFSESLPPDRQGEFYHRYVLGLYEILETLTKRFPDILFEGCASGGNRFDLGMLCYMPQIWASDNTDALCRTAIQQSYSYGYPLSVFSAHVSSCPNHQTLRQTPLATRFHVASFGLLGYECNLADMTKEELDAVKKQIAIYKKWRLVFQFGDFYRLKEITKPDSLQNPTGTIQWMCISADKTNAAIMTFQEKMIPNLVYEKIRTRGLAEDKDYHFYNIPQKINIKEFGDLINMISPIHIKKNSFTHNLVSKFYKMEEEKEDYVINGRNLNHCGIRLKQSFGGTGYNENTRFYTDFSSRMYYLESVEVSHENSNAIEEDSVNLSLENTEIVSNDIEITERDVQE